MKRILVAASAILALGSFGCSNTVRYMTATHWTTAAGGAGAPAAPASTEAGAANANAPPAPEAATAGSPAKSRVLYLTYWEGSCSGGALGFGRGCSKGDSHVRRCNVQPDNSLACVDDKEMGKALATE